MTGQRRGETLKISEKLAVEGMSRGDTMGKCKLEYQCGHTATVWLFGKTEIRQSYLEWTRKNEECPSCRREALSGVKDEQLTASVAATT